VKFEKHLLKKEKIGMISLMRMAILILKVLIIGKRIMKKLERNLINLQIL
jgi:hypothetical protein